ncbi:hypothetical protein LSAT2_020451, partial [Lamellibrachia satsuma]
MGPLRVVLAGLLVAIFVVQQAETRSLKKKKFDDLSELLRELKKSPNSKPPSLPAKGNQIKIQTAQGLLEGTDRSRGTRRGIRGKRFMSIDRRGLGKKIKNQANKIKNKAKNKLNKVARAAGRQNKDRRGLGKKIKNKANKIKNNAKNKLNKVARAAGRQNKDRRGLGKKIKNKAKKLKNKAKNKLNKVARHWFHQNVPKLS